MDDRTKKILLVEDNPGDTRLIMEMLAGAGARDYAIDWVSNLSDALERLSGEGIDLVLLDLGLPDSKGLETFINAYTHAPQVPFVILSGLSDETVALAAVRKGAQDYLLKNEIDSNFLLRTIRYATERKLAEKAMEAERQKLYSLLNSLPAFVYLRGADYTIRFANRRFREIFGETEDKPCYQVLTGKNEPCETCKPLRVLKTNIPQNFEWTVSYNARTYEVYNYPFCAGDDPQVLTLGVDITERKRAEAEIQRQRDQLRALAIRLSETQEVERQKFARELHDQVCQNLASIALTLGTLKIRAQQEPLERLLNRLSDASTLVEQTSDIARGIMEGLRPTVLEHYGLMGGLRQLGSQFSQRTGIHLEIVGEEADYRLKPNVELALFRIAQEALNNVTKHSLASQVVLTQEADQDTMRLVIADNGAGFDQNLVTKPKEGRGWGLMTMTERAIAVGGQCRIESQLHQGTRVVVEVPR